MIDTDADEIVPPLKKKVLGSSYLTDNLLIIGGVGLAGLAAFFPWYVFINAKQFTHRANTMITSRDLPELPVRAVVNPVPSAIPDSDAAQTSVNTDTVITGTVPVEEVPADTAKDQPPADDQPMPRNTTFRILHISNGQVMVENAGGVFLAHVGELLPDDSHIATLEQRDGQWVVVTDQGKVIKQAEQ